ncbi:MULTISPECIES: transposase [Paraburkholderia]|uniref:Transposase n=1 Tax=Paraburkholderia tropica TaxID=92647 RepID=A0A1A5X5K2_9BURK|nr:MULTISPECIES: transposase [Paraburkholderia]MBB2983789.1 transposase [Paraburkholderia tropica]MBB3002456.1 transposase [Paraburkholderia tropica]MBB6317586.1 transposase [Paraburkholderia tropica]MDE1142758.1 transposase [Paraburkholderia tropica]OBR48619.1 transposase [Paraburkholderia tropica]
MTPHRDITEEEWQRVLPLLPELRPRSELRGRPLANTRSVLNGVLWVMYSGATWSAMPRRYPSYQTCHRRFKAWHDEGVLKAVMAELFGEEGAALCDAIETRMRRHASRAEKAARTQEELPMRNSPFSPAAPGVPQPFSYRSVYRHTV